MDMYKAAIDPVTNRPQFVIAYTVEEGGMWRFIMCDGTIDLDNEFNRLYQREDVLALRTFSMSHAHRRVIVKAWTEEA